MAERATAPRLESEGNSDQPAPQPRGPEPPAVGAQVWYLHWSAEWIRAEIIDGIRAEDNDGLPYKYTEPDPGTVHLRIELNPRRHFSSRTFGYRKNVPQGTQRGNWLPVPPANWQERMREEQMRAEIKREVRLAAMREGNEETPEARAALQTGQQALDNAWAPN